MVAHASPATPQGHFQARAFPTIAASGMFTSLYALSSVRLQGMSQLDNPFCWHDGTSPRHGHSAILTIETLTTGKKFPLLDEHTQRRRDHAGRSITSRRSSTDPRPGFEWQAGITPPPSASSMRLIEPPATSLMLPPPGQVARRETA